MPSLEALAEAHALDDFAKSVAEHAVALRSNVVEVNDGIKTTEELYRHVIKGRNVPFDYERLIEESRGY